MACGYVDVLYLIEYLESKDRDCHINTGVHGKMVNGEFEWAWEEPGGDFLRQDKESAGPTKNKVSLHLITRENLPIYHVGIDTIDGFCFSLHKKQTEEELDRVFDDYVLKRQDEVEASLNRLEELDITAD